MEGTSLADRSEEELQEVRDLDKDYDKILKKYASKNAETIKMLLLGAGESGKTTVLRQMTLLHGGGFKPAYRDGMRPKICYNILEGAAHIIQEAANLKYDLSGIQKTVDFILERWQETMYSAGIDLDEALVDAILLLANSENFEETFRGKASDLQDGWWIFLERLKQFPAWGGPNWVPDDSDILHSRIRTTGFNTQEFNLNGISFHLTDVGGQRNERKKWMHLFNGITGVIFVSSLSEYDQKLFEDRSTNRLDESIRLWHKTVREKPFRRTAAVLFLNKFDLFQKKFYDQKIPIEYKGGRSPPTPDQEEDRNCAKAIKWYQELYLEHCPADRKESVFIHITTALDKRNMKKVMNSVATYILQEKMSATSHDSLPV